MRMQSLKFLAFKSLHKLTWLVGMYVIHGSENCLNVSTPWPPGKVILMYKTINARKSSLYRIALLELLFFVLGETGCQVI